MTVFAIQNPMTMDGGGRLTPKFKDVEARSSKYGELVWLLSPSANPLSDVDSLVEELHDKLENYTGSDYIILIGNPILIAAAVTIAAFWNDGCVNLLQWSNGGYIPVFLNLHEVHALRSNDNEVI